MTNPSIPPPGPPDLEEFPPLLTAYDLARILRVSPRTAVRWALRKKLVSIRTPGGQHRFLESDIRALFNGGQR